MKDDYYLPTTTSIVSSRKKDSSSIVNCRSLGKVRYKIWGLVVVLLLAFWSLFTGSVTLDWSTAHFSSAATMHEDLDILEVEDREKVVRHMWEVYTHSSSSATKSMMSRLPRFWEDAFEAAYDHLVSDVPQVRSAAVWEIAKMSMRSVVLPIESPINKSDQEAAITTETEQ